MSRFGGVCVLVFVVLCLAKKAGIGPKVIVGGILMDTVVLFLLVFITTTAVLGGL
jgi:hypothetical protein